MGSAFGAFFGAARCGGAGLGCCGTRWRGGGAALWSCAGAAAAVRRRRTGFRPGSCGGGGGCGCGRRRRCSESRPSGSSDPPGTCAGSPGKSVWREEAGTQLEDSGSVGGAEEGEGFPVGWGRSLRTRWSCSGTCLSIPYEDGTLIQSL